MELDKIAKKLEGLQTVSTIAKTLDINKRTAINYAWKLRKKGLLTTDYGSRKIRLYRISLLNKKRNGYSLYELINENSKVKIAVREDFIMHSDRKPSVEEVLARGIVTARFRIVLASLGLFNKIKDWPKLKFFADKYHINRKVGSLYDVSRNVMKVRKMDKRTRNALLKNKKGREYIIKNLKTDDFQAIEELWDVYIPFNRADLEAYKE